MTSPERAASLEPRTRPHPTGRRGPHPSPAARAAAPPKSAVPTGGPPPASDDLPADRFLDRELSWLAFNERVLELAESSHVPLLERARFLAIFGSNLDEFFMVRVAGLKRRIATGLAAPSAAGLAPREVLEAISVRTQALMARHSRIFTDQVRPALAAENIRIVSWQDLSHAEQQRLRVMFEEQVFPILTPLAVDPAHPFPYISGLSLNLAVTVRNLVTGTEHFARVKVPPVLPRFLEVENPDEQVGPIGSRPVRFIGLEEVIAVHLDQLFPGMEVLQTHTFRVTRNEDVEVEEDDAENLLQALEKELLRRRFGPPVRLEVADDIDQHVLGLLIRELGVHRNEVYSLPRPLDLRGLHDVADAPRPDLAYPRFVPRTHSDLTEGRETAKPANIFSSIRRGDVLLHHPYDSFSTSVQAFLEQAATDPKVLAIKQTLYRTSGDSPIVDALIDAADAGKQVLALVEIKARFDEQANISWARKLEQAGVHVVYGMVGLKTHAKLSLVVRQEVDTMRRYCHVGTGNYNPKTARMYEDVGILTCHPDVGEDLSRLFNQLSGYAPRTAFRRVLVAPRSMRDGLIDRIRREVRAHEQGLPARVRIKVNSIVDEKLIDALYRAGQAGVPVDLVVRGICAVKPGVPGLSETIRVRSILGRFLEHSRIFAFEGGGSPVVFIGSGDLMHRNLDRRVEALIEVAEPQHRAYLNTVLDFAMADGTGSWRLGPDGRWTGRHLDAQGSPLMDLQAHLIAARGLRASTRR